MLNRRVIAKFGAAYLALAAVLTLVMGSFNWWELRSLTARGLTTEGRIVELECEQHSRARFHFTVAGKKFEGLDNVPNCRTTQRGDTLEVTYLPEAPTVNLAGSAAQRLQDETVSIALTALLGPVLMLFFFVQRRKHDAAKRSKAK